MSEAGGAPARVVGSVMRSVTGTTMRGTGITMTGIGTIVTETGVVIDIVTGGGIGTAHVIGAVAEKGIEIMLETSIERCLWPHPFLLCSVLLSDKVYKDVREERGRADKRKAER